MIRLVVIALAAWLWCLPAWAEIQETDLQPTLDQFEAPALELGVPKFLAVAVAGVESGLRPWVLNIEGQPFRFDSKEKALEKALEAWEAGRSFDVGIMQVNCWWLRRYDISLEAALDPLANIYFGSWILKQEIDRHGGDLRAAVGAYHSPTPDRANHYADMVMAALERGPQPAKAPAKQPAGKPQDVVQPKRDPGRRQPKMLDEEADAPAGSGMLIVSQKAGLATPGSMKAAPTLPGNSMKVHQKKEIEP